MINKQQNVTFIFAEIAKLQAKCISYPDFFFKKKIGEKAIKVIFTMKYCLQEKIHYS